MKLRIFLSLAVMLVLTTGCPSEHTKRIELGNRTDRLYEVYINDGRDEARRSILEANHLFEDAKLSDFEESRAFILFLGYARLYALDYRAGSNDMVHADLIKARYWCLRSRELHGDTPGESDEYVDKFAGEKVLINFIDNWDKSANHGHDSNYIMHP
jgi:hypothetical protein